jgi:hypothetical protein
VVICLGKNPAVYSTRKSRQIAMQQKRASESADETALRLTNTFVIFREVVFKPL